MRFTFVVLFVGALSHAAASETDAMRSGPVAAPLPAPTADTVERNGLAVGYRLQYSASTHFPGYQLTLIFDEKADKERTIAPRVLLQDATGIVMQPASGERLAAQASVVAHTPLPAIPPPPPTYQMQGTIYFSDGRSASYSGTARQQSSFSEGFVRGQAIRANRDAKKDREEGMRMNRWLAAWLSPSYTLPARGSVSGWLLYSDRTSPSRLTVDIDGERYVFESIALSR
jgi:hypothetical protein